MSKEYDLRYEMLVLQNTIETMGEQEGHLRGGAYLKEATAARMQEAIDSNGKADPKLVEKAQIEIRGNLEVARAARVEADEIRKRAKSVLERLEVVEKSLNDKGD